MRQMKKLLFMMILTMLLSGESLMQAQCLFNNYTTVKREIPIKGVGNGTKGDLVMRSGTFQYIRAFINDRNISVIFLEHMENALISVRNADTGQIVYSEEYYSPNNVKIQLDAERGNFQISIISEDIEFQGDFSF